MNKEEFDAMLERLRAALEEADKLMVEAKVEYAKATSRFKEAKRMHDAHLSWGRAVGFVHEPDILEDVVGMVGQDPPDDMAKRLGVTRRAVAGALRRAVNKGLLVKTEDGYARA